MSYALVQRDKFVFHLTNIKNVSSILINGLLSKNQVLAKRIKIIDVSHENIQDDRAAKLIPNTSYYLHDCVPMFFGARPPMLLAIRYKGISQEDMVYVIVKWNIIGTSEVWFTDGNAVMYDTSFFQDIEDIDNVDFSAASALRWDTDREFRRKKQAEVLRLNKVDLTEIFGFVVYNETAKGNVTEMLNAQNIDLKVFIAQEFYYE